MKPKILILIGIIFIIFACNNDDENPQTEINGEYVGIFERDGRSSNVEFTFNNGTWTGESQIVKFPALCYGTYSNSGNVITFENHCAWTTEFDGTLILVGEWNYSLNGNSLILTNTYRDKYTLTKKL